MMPFVNTTSAGTRFVPQPGSSRNATARVARRLERMQPPSAREASLSAPRGPRTRSLPGPPRFPDPFGTAAATLRGPSRRRSMSHRRNAVPAPNLDATRLAAARRRLLRWYRSARRDLPWRQTRDPYRIWISEIMLQQTRVDTVVTRYERFLRRFPSLGALARA